MREDLFGQGTDKSEKKRIEAMKVKRRIKTNSKCLSVFERLVIGRLVWKRDEEQRVVCWSSDTTPEGVSYQEISRVVPDVSL